LAASQLVLEIENAEPLNAPGFGRAPVIALELAPGDLALIDARDATHAAWFADLCCGLAPPAKGTVRFLGQDWTAVPRQFAAGLRGRIGHIFADGAWADFLDTATNVLLPQLHHTHRDPRTLRQAAAELAFYFGLPGLPMGLPKDLSSADRARAACVRAFLGDPALLLLESPLQGRFAELLPPLLNALASARSRGAAAIWLTASDLVWRDRSFPATHSLRLSEGGLVPARRFG
jgi:phospholipid/cholesterol/gamma-HCH transport system ATP-binding protein